MVSSFPASPTSRSDAPNSQSGRALLIGRAPDALRNARNTLAELGIAVDIAPHPEAILNDPVPHRWIVLLTEPGESSPVSELFLRRLRARAEVLVWTPVAPPLSQLGGWLSDRRVSQFLSGPQALGAELATAVFKWRSGELFGLERYLQPAIAATRAPIPIECARIFDLSGRSAAIDAAIGYAEAGGIRRQQRTSIAQVCEELLMNALYDAPIDHTGRQLFADVDPRERGGMASPRSVSLRYAQNQEFFAVAVRDRYGRLTKDIILSYLAKCLTSTEQIDRKTYGAGLGLYVVLSSVAGFFVNVAPNLATEIVCLFRRNARVPLGAFGFFVHPDISHMGGDALDADSAVTDPSVATSLSRHWVKTGPKLIATATQTEKSPS